MPEKDVNSSSRPSAKIDEIAQKLDSLSASVDERFKTIGERFNAVDEHFAEQRRYTEFAFETLRTEMRAGFQQLERRMDQFIDTQGGINRNHEIRIGTLERRRAGRREKP